MFYFDKLRLVELYLQLKVRSVFLQHLYQHMTYFSYYCFVFQCVFCLGAQEEQGGDEISGAKEILKVGIDFDIGLLNSSLPSFSSIQ